ncbi:MAG: AI-2E family transporter [Nitrospiraceae bacterium]|nr:AI-2E family transporter [Nitrospiraceae bacterium]
MNRLSYILSLAIVGLLGYLTYQIFSPFLVAIAWAVVFCVIFYPIYLLIRRVLKFPAFASAATVLLLVAVIIGPLSYISFSLVSEVSDFVLASGKSEGQLYDRILKDTRVVSLIDRLGPYAGVSRESARSFLIEGGRKLAQGALSSLSSGFANMVTVAMDFVLMLFTVFFLFRDGTSLAGRIKEYLPFPAAEKERLAHQAQDMIVSTIYGGVVVAISQGILGGIAFALFGIESPVLWGSVMALCSFLPAVGTAIIWGPASLVFLIQGAYLKAIGLVLVGVFVISMVDNILRPLIIGGRTKMPTIIIFFTVLGGIKFFGLLGLIMGPLVFALFLTIFEILSTPDATSD